MGTRVIYTNVPTNPAQAMDNIDVIAETEKSVEIRTPRKRTDMDDSSPRKTQAQYDEMSLTSKRMMIAGGFLDMALFTSNCEQLKFAIDSRDLSSLGRYHFVVVMLSISLTLQAMMAILLFSSGFFAESRTSQGKQRIINHVIMVLVALVSLVNIVITTFSNKGEITKFCMSMKQIADGIPGEDVTIGYAS